MCVVIGKKLRKQKKWLFKGGHWMSEKEKPRMKEVKERKKVIRVQ